MTEGFPGGAVGAEEHERTRVIQRAAVLDFGGQYVDLVRKGIERQGIPADVLPSDTSVEFLEANYGAVVASGSPASSHVETAPRPAPGLWESSLPILGICYGMQDMARAMGGTIERGALREDGRTVTKVDNTHPIFAGAKAEQSALFTHGDFVTSVPDGVQVLGRHEIQTDSESTTTVFSAIAMGNKIGVQFHPEVFDDTPGGHELFGRFLHGIAGIPVDEEFQAARLEHIIVAKQRQIAEQVDGRHVIAFISGGVDSSVAATLAAAVINPDKFHGFYIDNGFMRDEDDEVIQILQAAGINVEKLDATERFEQATATIDGELAGPLIDTTDPQAKRKIIGKAFIDVQNEIIASLGLEMAETLLLMGTNAADRIESGHSTGGMHTAVIKTHHNQVQEVQDLKVAGLVIEPIDDLFKDEVRALGHELGLPASLVERQPFPGPGTAIRIITAPEAQPVLPKAAEEDAIRAFVAGRRFDTDQAVNVHVLPVRSVGVGGDERSHISVVAVDNAGLSTADMANLAHDIPAHFRGIVNRVIYALGPQPLAYRTVTQTLLTRNSRDQLRHADRIVFEEMRAQGLLAAIKQLPVVLLPLSFRSPGERAIVLRPVTTSTFMTVQAMLPGRDLPDDFFRVTTARILGEVPGISQVFLDLTNKPPGTTEWE